MFKLPDDHRRRMRTSNPIERSIQQEIKRRTRKIRVFPNEASLERLVTAVLVEIDEKWTASTQPYLTWKNIDADSPQEKVQTTGCVIRTREIAIFSDGLRTRLTQPAERRAHAPAFERMILPLRQLTPRARMFRSRRLLLDISHRRRWHRVPTTTSHLL